MITNDRYVAELQKMASDETKDHASAATKEYNSNRGENRRYLGGLFSKAEEVEDQMTSATKKVLDHRDESGSPFIKVAARQIFDELMTGSIWEKSASMAYREVAFRSFTSELEKLAALKPQTMSQLAMKNRVANASPKVWDLSSPISGGAKAALPQGSGTSVRESGGLLSRAAKAFGIGQ